MATTDLSSVIFPKAVEVPMFYRKHFGENRSRLVVSKGDKKIVDPVTQKPYGRSVSSDYRLLSHEEAVFTADKVIHTSGLVSSLGEPTWSIDFPSNGNRMLAIATFEKEVSVGKDMVRPQLRIQNSYDLSWPYYLLFGAFRIVCTNGLVVGDTLVSFRRKHTQGLNTDLMSRFIMKGIDEFNNKQVARWESWQKQSTLPSSYEHVMSGLVLSAKETEAIGREVEVSSDVVLNDIKLKTLSYWLFFNIVAQYVTHRVASTARQVELQARMARLF